MSDYCCKAFEAHVNLNFFTESNIDIDLPLYKTPWRCLIRSIGLGPPEANFMPLMYCPFCGTNLLENRNDNRK
jgi:hypothetical protein